mmetsp:Transcript_16849/g.20261  ORF Transcript_16849/g.20261 Transcript_16849/m.20261 type:complete len:129 (-) Transcript_16849:143-529(-)
MVWLASVAGFVKFVAAEPDRAFNASAEAKHAKMRRRKLGKKRVQKKKSEGTTNLRHPEQQSSVASISSSSASLSNAVNGRVKSQVSSSGSPSSISGNGLSSQMRNGQNMSTKNEELSIEETRNLKRKL